MPALMGLMFQWGRQVIIKEEKRKMVTYCEKCSKEDFLGDDVTEGVSINSAPQ